MTLNRNNPPQEDNRRSPKATSPPMQQKLATKENARPATAPITGTNDACKAGKKQEIEAATNINDYGKTNW